MARNSYQSVVTTVGASPAGVMALPDPYDALASPENDDLLGASLSMWPTGAAWGTPDGQAMSLSSTLAGLTRVMVDGFVWLYGRAWQLARQATMSGVSETLPEWERDYGLPESCFVGTQTTAQRLQALARKVSGIPTLNPAEFVTLAADYGFTIEIEEPALFRCGFSECASGQHVGGYTDETFWIVRVPGQGISYFEAGAGRCGDDLLFSLGETAELLCLLRKYAPAWSLPVLGEWVETAPLVDENGTPLTDEYGNEILITL
ncbi:MULTISPECIES: putative phage tail protein [unclassified Rhizobium]|uniref:putative phage tail protein n=1 Tax=unclassified Rhizobium TaxID=2613769 RepID=UPI00146B144B|nr:MULTISPECIES: putative phage tail protein [unclassified Rhizobium]MBD9445751.1 DUF2313 domain-containing protein [Rhizobium sp. RHZ01]